MGNGAGDINATAEPTDGQLLIGKTGNFPVLGSLTAGAGISVTGGSGTITIAATGGGLTWAEVTGASQALVADNGYLANRGTLITFTLPGTCAQFAEIKITGMSAGLWKIAQNANQMIHFGSKTTTTGIGGYVSSLTNYDSVTLRCTVANLEFVIETATGNLNLV
jgi:hypothetical protein